MVERYLKQNNNMSNRLLSMAYRNIALLLIVILSLSACVAYEKREGENSPRNPDYDHDLLVIEFDDQGDLWKPESSVKTILDNIHANQEQNKTIHLVIYVHGWKHHASSSDLGEFDEFLATYSKHKKTTEDTTVLGVYISWDGDPVLRRNFVEKKIMSLPRQLTFWNRKKVAEKIAETTATEIILGIAGIVKNGRNTKSMKVLDSSVVIIGHSMGGLIVERAVSQAMVGALLISNSGHKAFENIRFKLEKKRGEQKNEIVNLQLKTKAARTELDLLNGSNEAIKSLIDKNKIQQTNAREDISKKSTAIDTRVNEVVDLKLSRSDKEKQLQLEKTTHNELEWSEFLKYIKVANPNYLIEVNPSFGTSPESSLEAYLEIKLQIELQNRKEESHVRTDDSALNQEEISSAIQIQIDIITHKINQQLLENTIIELGERIEVYTDNILKFRKKLKVLVTELEILDSESVMLQEKTEITNEKITTFPFDFDATSLAISSLNISLEAIESNLLVNNRELLEPPADLILLINPASEGQLARKLRNALDNREFTDFQNVNGPFIISVSSKADLATRFAFPIARYFSGLSKRFRNDQRSLFVKTGPHNILLASHLIQNISAIGKVESLKIEKKWTFDVEKEGCPGRPGNNTNTNISDDIDCEGYPRTYSIVPCKSSLANSNYWVMRASDKLVRSHGSFFSHPDFRQMVFKLMSVREHYTGENRGFSTTGEETASNCDWPT